MILNILMPWINLIVVIGFGYLGCIVGLRINAWIEIPSNSQKDKDNE